MMSTMNILFVHSNFHTCHFRVAGPKKKNKENIKNENWGRRRAPARPHSDQVRYRGKFRLTSVENVSG